MKSNSCPKSNLHWKSNFCSKSSWMEEVMSFQKVLSTLRSVQFVTKSYVLRSVQFVTKSYVLTSKQYVTKIFLFFQDTSQTVTFSTSLVPTKVNFLVSKCKKLRITSKTLARCRYFFLNFAGNLWNKICITFQFLNST